MDAKQITHYAVQIHKLTTKRNYGTMMTVLGDLDKSCVTSEQMEMTDIVKVLYRLLRTCPDDAVKKTVKHLLAKWKRQYSNRPRVGKYLEGCEDSAVSTRNLFGGDDAEDNTLSAQEDSASAQTLTCGAEGQCVQASTVEQATYGLKSKSQDCTSNNSTNNTSTSSDFSSVRDKCVQLLLVALRPEQSNENKAAELATEVEHHIHEFHRASPVKYKACVRSKVANLKNPKSDHLRHGLLSGSLSPQAFARMSSEEMASVELRQLREEYTSHGVHEHQLPQGVEGTLTNRIHCKRCSGSDCRVTQVSRGALFLPAWVRRGGPDEDAMTFVTCGACGQQWYHSGWICL
ncbi:transcription elongation factor A N-terminal and central domain-containing protein [Thalassophryne amazonica]|uniref:transcription elongation factor A N-terminal and central domain-containing protein n=1 Tax=Thalassophryne amazonica TaxID=390379 RepID=UPI001470A656|nr:transcription elongation factor A N-terminal and central domain-containing protein [Thalassophryne amazonica]